MAEPEVSQQLFSTEEIDAAQNSETSNENNIEESKMVENTEKLLEDQILESELMEDEEEVDEEIAESKINCDKRTNKLEYSELIIDTEETEGTELLDADPDAEVTEGTENTESSTKKKAAKPTQDRITNLPIAKIKHIIKLDPDVNLVNAEAVFLITKTTELFIKSLAKEAFGYAAQNKKKTIAKNHVESALTMLPVEL